MRLSSFIKDNLDLIMGDFEEFSRRYLPHAENLSRDEIRDHMKAILLRVAAQIDEPAPPVAGEEGEDADIHGEMRAEQGFDILAVNAEYHWLRANILRHWFDRKKTLYAPDKQEMVRFHTALDEAQGTSVARFQEIVEGRRTTFLGILGHDIRNPLAAINGMTRLLGRSDNLTGGERALLDQIRVSVLHISAMTDNLLELARMQIGGALSVDKKTGDIGAICREVAEEVSMAYAESDVRLDVDGGLLCGFDDTRMHQALANLVRNAIQHGNRGKPVRLAAKRRGHDIVLTVHNEGAPIPQNELDRISRCFSFAGVGSSCAGRQGLGLYIVSQVVRAHGGTVAVSSSRKKGTVFEVVFPC